MVLFVRTIASDEEVSDNESVSAGEESDNPEQQTDKSTKALKAQNKKKRQRQSKEPTQVLNSEFTFDEHDDGADINDGNVAIQQSWDFEAAIRDIEKTEHPAQKLTTSLGTKIQQTLDTREKRLARKKKKEEKENAGKVSESETAVEDETKDNVDESEANDSDSSAADKQSSEEGSDRYSSEEENSGDDGSNVDDDDANSDNEEEEEEEEDTGNIIHVAVPKKKRISAEEAKKVAVAFSQLNLSRPLLRAVKVLGFQNPTPIQARSIPLILKGRDVCGSAVTGSGKTAAYLLPILERLLFRSRRTAATRVLIVTPTRELAQQVLSMLQKLGQFTDVTAVAVVGGLSLQVQATELRGRPDIVVCTPGRLIDHVRNTQSVDLDDVEILVLDEADRLLELGFKDEIAELVKFCPKQRQTLLFSATMSDEVGKLVDLSLNQPMRIEADPLFDMAQRLLQEFVRIRESRECDREAILLSLCKRSFKTGVIVFFKRKQRAHRMGIIFGLCGLKAAELHGNLTQRQRLESLQKFRDGHVDYLLCTDLAARGLDIQGVQTVINTEMPTELTSYVHRVGRTARAGRGGVAITLVGEQQRKIMREVLKRSKQNVKSRQVPQGIVEKYREEIEGLEDDIKDVFRQEYLEKETRLAEMEVTKATNMIAHRAEIAARPQRTWFQSANQKEAVKKASKEASDAREFEATNGVGDDMGSARNAKERRKELRKVEREAKKEKVPHRLSRKKRRRMEMLAAQKEDQQRALREAQAKADEVGAKLSEKETRKLKVPLEKQLQVSVKSAKRKEREKDLSEMGKIPGELHKESKKAKKVSTSNTRKVEFVGGFDSELGQGGAASALDARLGKKQRSGKLGKDVFKEHDVLTKGGLRKGGKLGNKKFKSRSKFKRR